MIGLVSWVDPEWCVICCCISNDGQLCVPFHFTLGIFDGHQNLTGLLCNPLTTVAWSPVVFIPTCPSSRFSRGTPTRPILSEQRVDAAGGSAI